MIKILIIISLLSSCVLSIEHPKEKIDDYLDIGDQIVKILDSLSLRERNNINNAIIALNKRKYLFEEKGYKIFYKAVNNNEGGNQYKTINLYVSTVFAYKNQHFAFNIEPPNKNHSYYTIYTFPLDSRAYNKLCIIDVLGITVSRDKVERFCKTRNDYQGYVSYNDRVFEKLVKPTKADVKRYLSDIKDKKSFVYRGWRYY